MTVEEMVSRAAGFAADGYPRCTLVLDRVGLDELAADASRLVTSPWAPPRTVAQSWFGVEMAARLERAIEGASDRGRGKFDNIELIRAPEIGEWAVGL